MKNFLIMKMCNFLSILKKPQNVFLIFALFWGLMFAVINPPFQAPDEYAHMYKIYGYTDFSLSFKKLNSRAGQILPISLTKTVKDFTRVTFFPSSKLSKSEIIKSLDIPLEKNKTSFQVYNPASYTPVSYFPHFLVMWVMKVLSVNPIWMMYILRIVSLITYVALVYTAIKTTPIKKWLFVLISILPMSLYEASALSTDALTMGLSFLYIAYVLKIALCNKVFSKKDGVIFALLITLISICKFAYLPLILMYFMIPKEKFPNGRMAYFFWVLVLNVLFIGAFLACTIHNVSGLVPEFSQRHLKSISEVLKFIITHPLTYLHGVFETVFRLTTEYIETIIGRFGWMDTCLPVFVINSYVLLLIFASVFNTEDENSDGNIDYTLKMKLIGVGIYALTFFITLTSVYLIFQQWPVITGLQGRYLLPVFPLMCLFFTTKKLKFKYLPLLIVISSIFLLFVSIIVLIKRFYI